MGTYYIPINLTDGNTTVTADDVGTVDISSLLPTKTSDLTNDSGYITSSALTPYVLSSSLATVATSGSYNDLSDKPTIPTVDQTYDGTSANAQSGVAVASAISGKANTDLSNISGTSTKSIDGQWVQANETIASDVSWTGDGQSVTYSVSSFLPNDNYIYECMIIAFCTTSNTSAKFIDVQLSSDVLTNSINVCHIRTRTSSTVDSSGNIILPVGTGRYITQKGSASSNADGTYSLYLRGYRRVGTNT
jgi:hypothetical protein